MRMYRKKSETPEKAVYEYLCENYQFPYTGLIEISKKTGKASLLKLADNEASAERAAFYAEKVLPRENYPSQRTHTAW